MSQRPLMLAVAAVFAFALAVRLALLACVLPALRVSEFSDDALYYRALMKDPAMLMSGRVTGELEGGIIYSPLMPFGIAFPGRWLANAFGFSVGHRLAMILFDCLAVGAALGVAWRAAGPPKGVKDWCVALALASVPGSALASAVWGQEDTLASAWASLCLLSLAAGRPVLAAVLAGCGVFTIKMFAVLVVFGIWLGSPGRRRSVAAAGAVPVILFVGFILARWYLSGLATPAPDYKGLTNSPSLYAAFYYVVAPVTSVQVRPFVMAITAAVMGGLAWRSLKRTPTISAAVVGVHAAFFLTFIGIQPEHHQWFMPFLLYVAWSAYRAGEVALPLAMWAFSAMAYGYKVAFGLQGGASAASAGKDVFRNWFAEHVQASLFPAQMLMLVLTIATGLLVCVLSFRFGVRQRRGLVADGGEDPNAQPPPAVPGGTTEARFDPNSAVP